MKQFLRRLAVIWCGVVMFLFVQLYLGGIDTWKEESGYPTRHAYVMLNCFSIFRFFLLKSGIPDDSWIEDGLEAVSEHYYQEGIKQIPLNDAERMHWRYLQYLRPYQGWFLQTDEISDSKKLIQEAVTIVTRYPEMQAKNTSILKRYGFREVAYSFLFATETVSKGSPTPEQARSMVIASEKALQNLSGSYDLLPQENQGIYGLFLFQSLKWGSALIARRWDVDHYTCADPLIAAYVQLRSHFPARITSILGRNALKRGNIGKTNKYQAKAEEILAKQCNIHFQEVTL